MNANLEPSKRAAELIDALNLEPLAMESGLFTVAYVSKLEVRSSDGVSPAWNPNRARVGADQEFIDRYAGSTEWATESFLRSLIGPNFGMSHAEGREGGNVVIEISANNEILWRGGMQLTLLQLEHMARLWKEEDPQPEVIVNSHNSDHPSVDDIKSALEPLIVRFT